MTANTSPATTINAGAFSKLQILLPGETAAPGTATGKTGAPTAQTAGSSFNVTVNAVDANWNPVTSTDTVAITSSDSNAALPANAALVAGTKTLSVTPKTAASSTFTASDVTNGAMTANTSPATTVNAAAFSKLQILMPGETAAPGTATGKTGAAVGSDRGLLVHRHRQRGRRQLEPRLLHRHRRHHLHRRQRHAARQRRARRRHEDSLRHREDRRQRDVHRDRLTNGTMTANTSPATTINAGAFAKLQLLMPGETAAPGTATGKTGTPSAQTAGGAFTVTVNAVDANWNPVSSDRHGRHHLHRRERDPARQRSTRRRHQDLLGHAQDGRLATFTATDISNGSMTANTSPATTVNAGAFAKLQILMPGETAAPGTATGKTGTPSAQTAGSSFNVTVNAVDANWNLVTSTDTVGITSTDANATLPANAALVAGTKTFSVTAKTAGSATFTATDISNGAMTANTSPATTINAGAFSEAPDPAARRDRRPRHRHRQDRRPVRPDRRRRFNVTVNAVDANWNPVTSTDTVGITSTDANATLPANAALVAGTKTFSVTAKTAGSKTFTATDITNGAMTANTSPATTINAGAFSEAPDPAARRDRRTRHRHRQDRRPVRSDRRRHLQRHRQRRRRQLEPRHLHRHRRRSPPPTRTRRSRPTPHSSPAPRPSRSPRRPPAPRRSRRPTSPTAR